MAEQMFSNLKKEYLRFFLSSLLFVSFRLRSIV